MSVDRRVVIGDVLSYHCLVLCESALGKTQESRVAELQHPACEDTCDALIAGTRPACLTCESRGASEEEGGRLAFVS